MNAAHFLVKPSPKTRIKICGLTREADVDVAVAAGADAIGFVLYAPSPRAVTLERAAQLASRLPPFVTPVLLFVNESTSKVREAAARIPGAWLQFHGDESDAECWACSENGQIPYLRVARIPLGAEASNFDLVEYALQYQRARAILLDSHVQGYGGGGQTFSWSLLPPNVDAHLVLSGGLTPANVNDGITQVRGRGLSLSVDVSSGVEAISTEGLPLKGIKDADKIHQFIAAVRAADGLTS